MMWQSMWQSLCFHLIGGELQKLKWFSLRSYCSSLLAFFQVSWRAWFILLISFSKALIFPLVILPSNFFFFFSSNHAPYFNSLLLIIFLVYRCFILACISIAKEVLSRGMWKNKSKYKKGGRGSIVF